MDSKNLYVKLLEVQKEIGAISKDSENPYFKSNYFDINKLIEEVKPVLNKHGLILLQPLTHYEGKPGLSTMIIDSVTGESIETNTVLPENSDPQKMGSAITYFRRYALQSLLFLQAEDDDGNKASALDKEGFTYQDSVEGNAPNYSGTKVKSDSDYFFNTGISKKTGKPYWNKKHKKTGEITWLTEQEYAEQANGGRLPEFDPKDGEMMAALAGEKSRAEEFEEWANSEQA